MAVRKAKKNGACPKGSHKVRRGKRRLCMSKGR